MAIPVSKVVSLTDDLSRALGARQDARAATKVDLEQQLVDLGSIQEQYDALRVQVDATGTDEQKRVMLGLVNEFGTLRTAIEAAVAALA